MRTPEQRVASSLISTSVYAKQVARIQELELTEARVGGDARVPSRRGGAGLPHHAGWGLAMTTDLQSRGEG